MKYAFPTLTPELGIDTRNVSTLFDVCISVSPLPKRVCWCVFGHVEVVSFIVLH